ncbi:MAG: BrnT family toxin [Nitrospirota bacterium]
MEYEWDDRKARANRRRHGIDFADAVAVFSDDHALTIQDEHAGEERFITIGADALGCVLLVVYTWRGDRIRVISARKATGYERAQYEG